MFYVSQRTNRWFEPDRLTVAPPSWSLGVAVTRHRVFLRRDAEVIPCSPIRLEALFDGLLIWTRDRHGRGSFAVASVNVSDRSRVIDRIPFDPVIELQAGGHFQPPARLWFAATNRDRLQSIFYVDAKANGAWAGVQLALTPTLDSERDGLAMPRAIVNGDVTYVWYVGTAGGRGGVHLALGCDGRNWKKIGPVLTPGPVGSPDYLGLTAPWVYRAGSKYRMLYQGLPSKAILAASSFDGIEWSKEGYILFPGPPSAVDGAEVGFPVLMTIRGSEQLVYLGTDKGNRSSIMRVKAGDSLAPLQSRERVTPGLVQALQQVVDEASSLPIRSLEGDFRLRGEFPNRASSSTTGPCLRVNAWTVQRLSQSSTPVYRIGTRRRALIAKYGRSDYFNYREFDRTGVWFGSGEVAVPRASLVHVGDRAVLINRETKGRPLRDVIGEAAEWPKASAAVCRAFSADIASSLRPYSPKLIDFSTQLPRILVAKLEQLADLSNELEQGCKRLSVRGLNLEVRLVDVLAAAERAVSERPTWLAFGHGDFKMDHAYWDSNRLTVVDLEFAGWYDIDWLAHGMVLPPIRAFWSQFDCRINEANELEVSFSDDTVPGRAAIHASAVLGQLSSLPIAPARVLSYNLALLANLTDAMWEIDRKEARRMFWAHLGPLAWVYSAQSQLGLAGAKSEAESLLNLFSPRPVSTHNPRAPGVGKCP